MQLVLRLSVWLQENAGGEGGAPAQGEPAAPGGSFMDLMPMLVGVLLIFYFLAWRPQAKERRARENLLKSVQKGDKVITSSGMYGTVAALGEKEVTLKVDDKNNVRLRFSRQAIQNVLRDSPTDGDDDKDKKEE